MKARSLIIWGVVIATALTAPMIANWTSNTISERRWAKVQEDAKRHGVPLDPLTALADYRPGPYSENAAEGVKEVLRKMVKPQRPGSTEFQAGLKDEFKKSAEDIKSELLKGSKADPQRLATLLKPFDPYLHDLQIALSRPAWNFKRKWEQGIAILYPDFVHLRTLSRVLAAKAWVDWKSNPQKSMAALRAVIHLADHIQTEPASICIAVGRSIRVVAYQTAMHLGTAPGTTKGRQELLSLLREQLPSLNWKRLWRAENAAVLSSLPVMTTKKGLAELGMKEGDSYMRSYRSMIDTSAEVGRLMVDANIELKDKPNTLTSIQPAFERFGTPIQEAVSNYHEVIPMLLTINTGPVYAVKSEEALRRMSYLTLLMAKGPTPGKLPAEALRPEWTDPFSGKPFRIVANPYGFRLYSLGLNGKDDGGMAERNDDHIPFDIVVDLSPTGEFILADEELAHPTGPGAVTSL